MNPPHSLIPTNIPDFQAEGFGVAGDGAVPEGFGLAAVLGDVAKLVDLDLAVGVPFARSGGAVQAQKFDQLQPLVTDLDRLEALLAGVELAFPVILLDFAYDPVAEKLVHGDAPAAEHVYVNLRLSINTFAVPF